MNYILFSKTENFKDGARKIKIEALISDKECKLIEIHSLNKSILKEMGKSSSLVYFLTNDNSIQFYIVLLKNIEIKIVNKVGLIKNVLKFGFQEKMRMSGVCVPKSILLSHQTNQMKEMKFPLFIKSQKQVDVIIYCKNESEFYKNIKIIDDVTKYYIEEAVEEESLILKKFYYIGGVVVDMDQSRECEIPIWFQVILKNISESLTLDVFSTDVFIDWSTQNYFCIDINPASAFFKSDKAREEFIKNILI